MLFNSMNMDSGAAKADKFNPKSNKIEASQTVQVKVEVKAEKVDPFNVEAVVKKDSETGIVTFNGMTRQYLVDYAYQSKYWYLCLQ